MIVHKTKLVFVKNVKTHAQIHAVQMLNVMLLHIQPSVIVWLVIVAMHLSDAPQLQLKLILSIHVNHHHAVKIHNVQRTMVWPNVVVSHRILAMLMEPVAGPNVFTVQTVPAEWLAYDNIAVIHVQVFAVQMPNVLLSITFLFVHVNVTIKAMHSVDVDQYQEHVSIFVLFHYNLNCLVMVIIGKRLVPYNY